MTPVGTPTDSRIKTSSKTKRHVFLPLPLLALLLYRTYYHELSRKLLQKTSIKNIRLTSHLLSRSLSMIFNRRLHLIFRRFTHRQPANNRNGAASTVHCGAFAPHAEQDSTPLV